jgi:hypothetical protein
LITEWQSIFEKVARRYSSEEKLALAEGFCPSCIKRGYHVPYRLIETRFDTNLNMKVHHVRCLDFYQCEWDGLVPTVREDPGLENFFRS